MTSLRALLALLTAAFVATALMPAAEASHAARLPGPTGVDLARLMDSPVPGIDWCGWCLMNLTTVPSTVEGPAGTTNLVSRVATPEVCNPALIGSQAHCYHVHFGCYELGRGQVACWHGLVWCDPFVNGPLPGDVHLGNACTHA